MNNKTAESPNQSIKPNIDKDNQVKFDENLEFISLIVHDLQAPIASMKTLTKFLIAGKYNPENDLHAALVRSSKNALERTEAIIQDLLDSANQACFAIRLDPNLVDLREILKNSVDALSGSAFDHGVTLNLDLPKRQTIAKTDRYYLARVIDNLIYNALKHSSRGQSIFIKLESDNSEYIISITDQGPGFDEADKETIFDKYNQASLRKNNKYRGIGLGLYFCKLAISSMSGRIWAESNRGAGASFKIALKAEGND